MAKRSMQKTIHLVSGAHLDPVWLWQWEDGFREALSTFRIAEEFCQTVPGFRFNCHDTLMYEMIERLDPPLFARIRKQIRAGRWCVSSGYLVPADLHAPSGESHIRNFLYGRAYLKNRFGIEPIAIVNEDQFGQPEGYAQILQGCGYRFYSFCRPGIRQVDFRPGVFVWSDRSGARIVTRRSDDHYNTYKGNMYQKLTRWAGHYREEPVSMILWGLGNHGGGASKADLEGLRRFAEERPDLHLVHSCPQDYFTEAVPDSDLLPVRDTPFENCCPGCYTSMAQVKRAMRRAEWLVQETERLASLLWWTRGNVYPGSELRDAWKDIVFCQDHDILPGTCTASAENDTLELLGGVVQRLRKVKFELLACLVQGQHRAKDGEVALFVWNPHGYSIRTVVEFEYAASHENYPPGTLDIRIACNGKSVPFQRLREENNIGRDWIVRVALAVEVPAFSTKRFDAGCVVRATPVPVVPARHVERTVHFRYRSTEIHLSGKTGLVDHFGPENRSLLSSGALAPVAFMDSDNPWSSGTPMLRKRLKQDSLTHGIWKSTPDARFRLATRAEAARVCGRIRDRAAAAPEPFGIIEDGPVMTLVEGVFVWGRSVVIRKYRFVKTAGDFSFTDHVIWNEKDMCLKVEIPLAFDPGATVAESPYSAARREADTVHRDQPNQRWVCAAEKGAGGRFVAVVNHASYGYSVSKRKLYVNVLRSPAYTSFGLAGQPNLNGGHHVPRMDQGEHNVTFGILGGAPFREDRVAISADLLNMPPVAFPFYSVGNARDCVVSETPFLAVKPGTVRVTAVKQAEDGSGLVVRLQELAGKKTRGHLSMHGMPRPLSFDIGPFALKTLLIKRTRNGIRVSDTDLVEGGLVKTQL